MFWLQISGHNTAFGRLDTLMEANQQAAWSSANKPGWCGAPPLGVILGPCTETVLKRELKIQKRWFFAVDESECTWFAVPGLSPQRNYCRNCEGAVEAPKRRLQRRHPSLPRSDQRQLIIVTCSATRFIFSSSSSSRSSVNSLLYINTHKCDPAANLHCPLETCVCVCITFLN